MVDCFFFIDSGAQKLVFDPKNENVLVPPPKFAASIEVKTIQVELYNYGFAY